MKTLDPITEIKQVLLQRQKQRRDKQIRIAAKAEGGRVPVDGIDAHKVAWKIIDRIEKKENMVKGYKLHRVQVEAIKHRLNRGETQRSIAEDYGVHPTMISKINTGEQWGHVKLKFSKGVA